MRAVSPNDMMKASCEHMLEGREPKTAADWQLLVNFWARNAESPHEEIICKVMAKLFNCPLPDQSIHEIADFQINSKKKPLSKPPRARPLTAVRRNGTSPRTKDY